MPEDPTFMKHYRRSMSSEVKFKYNQNKNDKVQVEDLLQNANSLEHEIRPWAISNWDDQ